MINLSVLFFILFGIFKWINKVGVCQYTPVLRNVETLGAWGVQ